MIRKLEIILFVAASLIILGQPVYGSSGGVTAVGAFSSAANDDTGSRQWVTLRSAGGLLCGTPNHKVIDLITVYAPGMDSGHLILRELELPDGKRSILLSAPNSLMEKTLRATIYMKASSRNSVLLEHVGGKWEHSHPVQLSLASENSHEAAHRDLLAYPVKGIGLYCLSESNSSELVGPLEVPADTSASRALGGSVTRGFLPWVSAALLLLIGWAISYCLHIFERAKGV